MRSNNFSISCLLFLVGLSFFTNADPFLCDNLLTIDPPANLSQTYFYPTSWNNSYDPMQYASGQNCTWVINVPSGMFAYFALKSQTTINTHLSVIDSLNQATRIGDVDMEPFFFNSPKFTIQLNAQTVGKLGFRVDWHKYPSFTPQNYQVTAQGDPLVLWTGDTDNATVLTADTQVSLVSLSTSNAMFVYYMRATFLYDGPTWNSTFLGNLYDVVQSGKQLVSTGKQMTLFSLYPGFIIGAGSLIQDYSGVKDIVQYRGIFCALINSCYIGLQAVNGKSALVTAYKDPIYLTEANISPNANLKVYTGKITDNNLITTYRRDVNGTNFPQKFPGYLTTYLLDQDTGLLMFKTSSSSAKWNEVRDGRRGFFVPENYLKSTPYNNANEQITGNGNYNFSMNVKQSGIVGNATLQLTVYSANGKNVYDEIFSKDKQVPNSLIVAQGTGFSVGYKTNGENTTGFMVEYEMTKMGGASLNLNYGLLIPMIFVIFSMVAF